MQSSSLLRKPILILPKHSFFSQTNNKRHPHLPIFAQIFDSTKKQSTSSQIFQEYLQISLFITHKQPMPLHFWKKNNNFC
ncbi:hypothetical protein Hanom_Chr10g00875261 [Helianthus anomalus]